MAWLVGVQQENGNWDAFVYDRFTAQMHYTVDVLGRELPHFRYIVAYEGVPKADAERLANELRGCLLYTSPSPRDS